MAEEPKVKIAVYNEEKFKALGFTPIRHPAGYMYFEKSDGPLELSSQEANAETSRLNPSNRAAVGSVVSQHENIKSEGLSGNRPASETDFPGHFMEQTELTTWHQLRYRQAMIKRWKKEIKEKKHSECILPNCNFVGLTVNAMIQHYKTCKNKPLASEDACRHCGAGLESREEREHHSSVCSALQAVTQEGMNANMKEKICLFCKQVQSCKSELLVHMGTCGGNGDVLPPNTINSLLRLMNGKDPSIVIQRPPIRGSDSYCRRRSYNKNHCEVWEAKIIADKYVRCHFQNCFFMAMSVEDMCSHFGDCDGDPSYAPFRCPECGGGVTTKDILHTHMQLSHPHLVNSTRETFRMDIVMKKETFEETAVIDFSMLDNNVAQIGGEPSVSAVHSTDSSQLDRSSGIETSDNCSEVMPGAVTQEGINANMMEKICLFCKQVQSCKWELLVHMGTCGGNGDILSPNTINSLLRLMNGKDPSIVIQRPPIRGSDSYCRRRSYNKNHCEVWEAKIIADKYVRCHFQNCFFMAMSVEDMCSHFGDCDSDPSYAPFRCPECGGGVTTKDILHTHMQLSHPHLVNSTRETFRMDIVTKRETFEETAVIDFSMLDNNVAQIRGEPSVSAVHSTDSSQLDRSSGIETSDNCNKVIPSTGSVPAKKQAIQPLLVSKQKKTVLDVNGEPSPRSSLTAPAESICIPSPRVIDRSEASFDETPSLAVNASEEFESANNENISIATPLRRELPSNGAESSQLSANTKKRGRPRGSKTTFEVVSVCTEQINDSKPKRRSRKFKSEDNSEALLADRNEGEGNTMNDTENSTADLEPQQSKHTRSARKRTLKAMQYDTGSEEDTISVKLEVRQGHDGSELSDVEVKPRKRKRRAQRKPNSTKLSGPTRCGKCSEDFVDGSLYLKHNYKVHNGLGWRIGEEPPDLNNEPMTLALLRDAFKANKIFRCENCFDVKRSVYGFITHLQLCGKTEEEKERMKVSCEICGKSVKPYSLPMHIRALHKANVITATVSDSDTELPSQNRNGASRRRSAIKCRSKIRKAVEDENENVCAFFRKGSAIHVLNDEMTKKWTLQLKNNKKATCLRDGCNFESPSVSFAVLHFFNCPKVPDSYYQCLMCKYFSTEEPDAKNHKLVHINEEGGMIREVEEYAASTDNDDGEAEGDEDDDGLNEFGEPHVVVKIEEQEPEELAEEEGMDSDDNVDPQNLSQSFSYSSKKKWKRGVRSEEVRDESKTEHGLRRSWAMHENLSSQSSATVYRAAFNKEFTRQLEQPSVVDEYPSLHTAAERWCRLPAASQSKFLPPMSRSLPLQFRGDDQLSECECLEPFDAVQFDETWSVFAGGPVLCLAWCPVDIRRVMANARQYLAVSVSRYVDQFLNFTEGKNSPTIIQIWDMGLSCTQAPEKPQMALGVATEYGEALCLTWAPTDTSTSLQDPFLPRLGLLAGAFQDGGARIFSLCDPTALPQNDKSGLPVYRVKPVVELVRHGVSESEACLRLTWGRSGLVVAGYKSGVLAMWNLSTLTTCPSRLRVADNITTLQAIRVLKPYSNPVTAVALCPINENLLLSSAKDRFVTFWDVTQPHEPYRVLQSALVDRLVWLKNWPAVVFASEDTVLTFDPSLDLRWRKQHTSCVANIKDFTFSDWTFIACFVNEAGEVLVRHWKDPYIEITKTRTKDNLMISQLEVRKGDRKEEYESYKEAEEDGAKLLFTELSQKYRDPTKIPKYADAPCTATFPLTTVNQVVFNPNYRHLSNLALGYQCGLIRMIRLSHNTLELNDLFTKYDEAVGDVGESV